MTSLHISHKIKLKPNNKQKTYFRKAFGCARLAYNWGLARCQENYKNGISNNFLELRKEFNAIKRTEFPFVYEVTKCACQQPFFDLKEAFDKFFNDLKIGKVSYPKFKRKSANQGSFYVDNENAHIIDENNKQYLKIAWLEKIRLTHKVRFNGKINNVVIKQHGNDFFAAISMEISELEYQNTHKIGSSSNHLGIDVGLNNFVCLSSGVSVYAPKPLKQLERRLKKLQRQLNKKQCPKTKGCKIKKSNNYIKHSKRVNKLYSRIHNIRQDFLHKLTSALIRHADNFYLEDLSISNMLKNKRLAKALSDVSIYEFNRQLKYKAKYAHKQIQRADRFYPSSKTCSSCGNVKQNLRLCDRTYNCEQCNLCIDRDYNASLNLQQIGGVTAEFTPADLTALLDDFAINHLTTSKVETGRQHKNSIL